MAPPRRAVIIGTGTGGLAAAAYLAKDGFDVLALEREDHLGGYLAPLTADGFVFDPGVHYVGACRPGQLVHQLLSRMGVDAGPLFSELDPTGFDVVRFPDQEIRVCTSLDDYKNRLSALFPGEERGLRQFFGVLGGAAKMHDALGNSIASRPKLADLVALTGVPSLLQWSQRPLRELIESCTKTPRLAAALAGQSGFVALPPSRVVALAALLYMAHFTGGAFFPRGGGGALRDALVRAGESHGARFRTGAPVERILVTRGRVTGVELAGGERIEADLVVSCIDPTLTLGKLLSGEEVSGSLRRKAAVTEPSMAVFTIFLGMRRDLRAHGLGAYNLWLHPSWDIEQEFEARFSGKLPARPLLLVSPTSLKDPSGALAPPGCSTLAVMAFVPYARFRKWQRLPLSGRGGAFEAYREEITQWMLSELSARCPGLVGDVVFREVRTPLWAFDQMRAVDGAPFGPAMTTTQWGPKGFRTRTPLAGLLLGGSGIFGGGVAPCLLSALSASVVARIGPK